ncbi:MAG: LysM peptidoglycan-binding domain-containing protein [Anaerolineales bacterium]|nr:LysM peptidoglycan-binding domain-containing protein [Anaerolineales bacterium]
MENKRILPLVVIASLILILSACVKPASKAPQVTATTVEGTFPVPGAMDDVMAQLESFATQTAVAMLGPGSAQATEAPAEFAEAPVASQPAVEATVAPQGAATQAPQKVVVPTQTPGIPKTYALQKGEHPYCIARRFDVNPEEMLRLSGLSGGSTFATGTVLKIPQSGRPFPGKRALKSHPTTYTVGSGDTIYTIACEFGDVSPNMIALANGLKPPYKLSAGQKLHIP